MKLKKNKETVYAVIVTCLLSDEKEPTKLMTRDFMTEVQAHTAEISCWRACKMIWMDAAKNKLSQPICGVKAMSKEQYLESVRLTKEQEEKDKKEVDTNSGLVPLPEPSKMGITNMGEALVVPLIQPEVS